MLLRPATNQDRAAIEDLIFSILRSYGLEPAPDSTDADLQDIEGNYLENEGRFDVLVSDENQIVGTVAVHRTTPALCELRKMYLSPTMRGMGWGRKLLDHALASAQSLGYSQVWLETAESLEEAHALYLAYGFTPFEGPHCSARCDFALVRDL